MPFACDKWGYDAAEYGVDINDYDFRDDNMDMAETNENLPLESRINSARAVTPKEQVESVKTKNIESEQYLR